MDRLFVLGNAFLAAVCFGYMIVVLARKGKLSLRYTVGWLFVGFSAFLGTVAARFAEPLARLLHTQAVYVIFGATALSFLLISVQLSVTSSGLINASRIAVEEIALLEERIRRMEEAKKC